MEDFYEKHDPIIDCDCRECAIVERDMLRVLVKDALKFTKYAAAAFAWAPEGSGTPEWFDGLREQIEELQPRLMPNVEVRGRPLLGDPT